MGKRKILFVLILFLLSGCATPPKAPMPKPQVKKGVLDGVLVFHHLEQIDLDNDGAKEIVAIYTTGINASGVKVIKFHNDTGDVIFERIFATPDVKFAMQGNMPTIITEETAQAAGCTRRVLKSIYRWDGKGFTFVGK